MRRITQRRLLHILIVLALGLAGWWLAPRAYDLLPAEVRDRLPEAVLARLVTPVPTALPAPEVAADDANRLIAAATPSPEAATETPEAGSEIGPAEALTEPAPALTATVSPTTSTPPTMTPTATTTPTPTPRSPERASVEGLRIIGQKFNNCGPANLSMVLDFYDSPADQLEIAADIRPSPDDRNVSPEELAGYVQRQSSLTARAFWGGNLGTLKRLLSGGYPVIIEKGLVPSEWQGWMGHYLTLVGYDNDQGAFLVLDSYLGPWDGTSGSVAYDDLDELWQQFNRAFVVVYPTGRESQVARLVGQLALDERTMWQAVTDTAREEARQDPENAFAWFNLGAGLTRLGLLGGSDEGLFEDATAAFDHARQIGLPWRMLWYRFEPYQAYLAAGRFDDVLTLSRALMSGGGWHVEETHLYQAHALAATGESAQAAAAYRRALEMNPNLTAAAEGLRLLEDGQ